MRRIGLCAIFVAAAMLLSASPAHADHRRYGRWGRGYRSGVGISIGGYGYGGGFAYSHFGYGGYYRRPFGYGMGIRYGAPVVGYGAAYRSPRYSSYYYPGYGGGYYYPSYGYGGYYGGWCY